MAGLQDDPNAPDIGWRVVGESNHDADDDSCEWCKTKKFRHILYTVENIDYYRQIIVGSSCKDKITKNATNSSSNDRTRERLEDGPSNGGDLPTEKTLPILELIFLAGISMVLLRNLGRMALK
ncbi:MAG: hypothetical protein ACKO24_00365 [Leptolyngbyaceae cyanobacterium]